MTASLPTKPGVIRESPDGGPTLEFEIDEVLHEETSPFQKIGFYRTPSHGVLLMLDGAVMLTERDEYVYHEMLAHVPMLAHPAPRRVLVIGGGDLGTARECLLHDQVEEVLVCEIDRRVVDLSREHFHWADAVARDDRVRLVYQDGFRLVERSELQGRFDIVLVDSSEAAGDEDSPARKLFTSEFFEPLRRTMSAEALLAGQCESAFRDSAFIGRTARELSASFARHAFYVATIPTYPAGLWTFYLATDANDPKTAFRQDAYEAIARQRPFRYLTPRLRQAAFALPADLERALGDC